MKYKVFIQFTFLFWLILGQGTISASIMALAQPSPNVSSFLQDDRLQKNITLHETGIQMEDLLKHLSQKGLVLIADPHCVRIKLQINLKARPLSVLMIGLADLTSGRWRPLENQSGYILTMKTSAIKQYETWWRLIDEERENAIALQRKAVLNAIQTPYKRTISTPQEPIDINEEEEQKNEERQNFWRALPLSLQKKIAEQIIDVMFYTGSLSYGNGIINEGATTIPLMNLHESERNTLLRGFPLEKLGYIMDNVNVQFANAGHYLAVSLVFPDGKTTGTQHNLNVPDARGAETLSLFYSNIEEETKNARTDLSPTRKKLLMYQKSRIWKNDLPVDKTRLGFRRVDALRRLGDQNQVEYIADYHIADGKWVRPSRPEELKQPLSRPVKEELDLIAQTWDVSWKKMTGNIVLVRNNRWYRDDLIEVPNKMLTQWLTKFAPKPKSPMPTQQVPETEEEGIRTQMDWEAEIVTSLTPWQVTRGLAWFCLEKETLTRKDKPNEASEGLFHLGLYPFNKVATRIIYQWNTARFYATLEADFRRALIRGQLPLSLLNVSQREQLQHIFPELAQRIKATDTPLLLRIKRQATPLNFTLINAQKVPVRSGVVLELFTQNVP